MFALKRMWFRISALMNTDLSELGKEEKKQEMILEFSICPYDESADSSKREKLIKSYT